MKAAFLKFALTFVFLLGLQAARPAAAQFLTPPTAADSLAEAVATHTNFLADAIRLSARQRREVAALLARQLSQPAFPVPAVDWLRILSLRQYQAWQLMGGPLNGTGPAQPAPEALLARRIR